MNKHNDFTEYEKAINFLQNGCNCGCSNKIPKEKFAEMWEAFQALSKSERDIFLMAQLKVMDGGIISNSRRLKKKTRTNKRTYYCWDRNTPLCQKTYLENMRNYLPRVHSNVKRIPQWKTKIKTLLQL